MGVGRMGMVNAICVGVAVLLHAGCSCGRDTSGADVNGIATHAESAPFGTSTDDGGSSDSQGDTACVPNATFFSEQVWPNAIASTCVSCHIENGLAPLRGAAFVLRSPGQTDAWVTNEEQVRTFLLRDVGGESLLLQKAAGAQEHGGGAVLAESSSAYAVLEAYLERVRAPQPCEDDGVPGGPPPIEITLESPTRTLYKAALQFLGRLPTDDEVATVRAGGEADLRDLIRGFFDEPAFLQRLKVMFNTMFLTDKYAPPILGLAHISGVTFPSKDVVGNNLDIRDAVNVGVSQEPLELIAHVVGHDRPFTEILTAPYMMVNPDSALVYESDAAFADPSNLSDFQPAQVNIASEGNASLQPFPHAGILSSPMFMMRYPTTPSNRSRHRARMVLEFFLGTDIFDMLVQPIDTDDLGDFAVPTLENPNCTVCHDILDPIAGAYRNWAYEDDLSQTLRINRGWYDDMLPAGLGSDVMPESAYPHALQWLGQKIAADPRFAYGIVRKLHFMVMGRTELKAPGVGDPQAADKLTAWTLQDAELRKLATGFEASGFDFKELLTDFVMSRVYRAEHSPVHGLGTDRLLTPEELHDKLVATTGASWGEGLGGVRLLSGTYYRLLYGGIDSSNVTDRAQSMSALMAAVAQRAGFEIACQQAPLDFTSDNRVLFPLVELADDATTSAGEAAIRENIAYMHARMLGEEPTAAAIDAVYALFANVQQEGAARVTVGEEAGVTPFYCGAVDDASYTLRAWMIVTSYFISHPRFLIH